MIEGPRADECRSDLQRTDRSHHPAREEEARHDRQQEADDEEQSAAGERRVQRREDFTERLLHQHDPAHRQDLGVRDEHLLSLQVSGDGRDLAAARH